MKKKHLYRPKKQRNVIKIIEKQFCFYTILVHIFSHEKCPGGSTVYYPNQIMFAFKRDYFYETPPCIRRMLSKNVISSGFPHSRREGSQILMVMGKCSLLGDFGDFNGGKREYLFSIYFLYIAPNSCFVYKMNE